MLNSGLNSGVDFVGEFRWEIRDRFGRFVSRGANRNTATNYLRSTVTQWLIGTNNTGYNPVSAPTRIALGNGSPTPPRTAPDPTDTALWAEVAGTRKVCAARQVSQGYYAQFTVVWTVNDPRGTFTEAGLLDDVGNLWAHVALQGVSLQTGQTLSGIWRILTKGS
jgi:hypothetical protein